MKKNKKTLMILVLLTVVATLTIIFLLLISGNEQKVIYEIKDGKRLELYRATEEEIRTDDRTGTDYVDDQLILTVADGYSDEELEKEVQRIGAEIVGRNDHLHTVQIRFATHFTLEELNSLRVYVQKQPWAVKAYANVLLQLQDEEIAVNSLKRVWDAYPDAMDWAVKAIHAPEMWDYMSRIETTTVNVGVLDNQFYSEHEELNFTKLHQKSFDPKYGSHGTHVAGTIAADSSNKKGIVGISENLRLYGESVEELDKRKYKKNIQGIEVSTLQAGLTSLICINECKVVNISYHFGSKNKKINKAISDMVTESLKLFLEEGYEFLICQAAGNSFKDVLSCFGNGGNDFYDSLHYIQDEEIRKRLLVVGATEQGSSGIYLADYSNYGTGVDLVAPGSDIYSCIYGTTFFGLIGISSYGYSSGTSMAAPHVSGVAANVWNVDPKLSGAEVKEILCNTAHGRYGYLYTTDKTAASFNYKMLDGYEAVKYAYTHKAEHRSVKKTGSDDWAAAYRAFLAEGYHAEEWKKMTYELIYLDEDDRPELAIHSDAPDSWLVLSWQNKEVIAIGDYWSTIQYTEGEGYVYFTGGHTGYRSSGLYRLKDGVFQRVGYSTHYEEAEQVISEYQWKDRTVSESDYQLAFELLWEAMTFSPVEFGCSYEELEQIFSAAEG